MEIINNLLGTVLEISLGVSLVIVILLLLIKSHLEAKKNNDFESWKSTLWPKDKTVDYDNIKVPYQEGSLTQYFILTRDDQDSPWLIRDATTRRRRRDGNCP
jgi:hypothetical protein